MAEAFLDEAGHERVARAAMEANPDLVQRARDRKDFFPIVRAAARSVPKDTVSDFWLAAIIGEIVRGER